ncbi:MAG: carotenoid 1,2-hydratase [Rhodocyclaceae bacterium]
MGDPHHHCALNVALYGASGKRWALTERGRNSLQRSASALSIGPSSLYWSGDALNILIDEVTAPWPTRVRGKVRLFPAAVTNQAFALDTEGAHSWWPIAPVSRVEVELDKPGLSWKGHAYLDCNFGAVPLEDDFTRWDWSRSTLADGRTVVFYDVSRRRGGDMGLALRFDANGEAGDLDPPPYQTLPDTSWKVARGARGDHGHPVRVEETLENAPFYARSLVATRLFGEPAMAMHESLSLDRFRSGWVQILLPFRMPRIAR